jgi:hypothetical protein
VNVVHFTRKPRRVTAPGPASKGEVVEFLDFRGLQLTLKVIGFEGASDPVLQIAMETGMRYASDFVPLGRFLPLVADGEATSRHFDGVLRFVRWNVVELEGAMAAWFVLEGEALP